MAVTGPAKERAVMREFREDKTERYYKRTYLVVVDNLKDDAIVVERAFGIPYANQSYITETTIDEKAKCYSKACNQVSLLHWEVVVEYSTKNDRGSGKNADPTLEPPVYNWGSTNVREIIPGQSIFKNYSPGQDPSDPTVKLFDSTGIVNSAFEPYMPPAEMDRAIPTLTFERNEPVFNHKYMLWYVNSVNYSMWYQWWPRTVKCASISGSRQVKIVNGKPRAYWKVQYVFHFNIFTWDLFLLDYGTYYLVGGSSLTPLVKKNFLIKGVPGLGLLAANGDASSSLAPGSPPVARYNRFKVLREADFGMLMIPLLQGSETFS